MFYAIDHIDYKERRSWCEHPLPLWAFDSEESALQGMSGGRYIAPDMDIFEIDEATFNAVCEREELDRRAEAAVESRS